MPLVPKYEIGVQWIQVPTKRKYWFGYRIKLQKRHVVYRVFPDNSRIAIAECFNIVDAYDIIDALNWKYADRPEGR